MRWSPLIAVVLLTAACGGGSTSDGGSQDTQAGSGGSGGTATGSVSPGDTLTAMVGEPDQPEAFTITLTGPDGELVETVPAGEYEIVVRDLAQIHNFHLAGPGVDESTSVTGTVETTWTVTFEPGDYTYVCDPHPSMSEAFTVV